MIYFMLDEQNYLDSAMIELSSESGKLVFQSDVSVKSLKVLKAPLP